MDRLLTMDKQEYVSRMQAECRRIMERIADEVNAAPTGNVISGSEMQVRDLMGELRRKAFETAVQMRIDSTESSFFPSEGCVGQPQAEQRPLVADDAERQRSGGASPGAVLRRRRGKRQSG